MSSVETLLNIPENHTVDFITPKIFGDYSYLFRKVYLPAAIIRLAKSENFAGEGEIHMTGRGLSGYHEARDYFHNSPDYDQTLRSLQGHPDDQSNAAISFGFGKRIPNIAQVIGLQLDPAKTSDHYHGKYYTTDGENVTTAVVDTNSRLGIYRLLGEPTKLDWFVQDIDPKLETNLRLHHISY